MSGEPILHAGVEDCLPTTHPLHNEDVRCEYCSQLVHANNNETMQAWVEGGLGAFCLLCFACDEWPEAHWLPGHEDPQDKADYLEGALARIKNGMNHGR